MLTGRDSATNASHEEKRREPWFARLARFSARRRRWVMTIWLLLVLASAPLAATLTGAMSGAGWEAQGSTAQKVRDELRRDFPEAGAEAAIVVYHQGTPITTDRAGLVKVVGSIRGSPGVVGQLEADLGHESPYRPLSSSATEPR